MDLITLGALKRLSFPELSHSSFNLAAASAGTQAAATPIASALARFTTVGGSGYSGLLPAARGGRFITVANEGANTLAIFPTGTDAIDALGASASYSIPAGQVVTFVCLVAGQWYSDIPSNTTMANLTLTGQLQESVGAAVTAAGTTQGGATALTAQLNNVSTGTSNQGVLLPTGVAGMRILVFNATGNTIKIYPAGSGTIDGGSASAAVTLTSLHRGAEFVCFSANTWVSTLLGAVSS